MIATDTLMCWRIDYMHGGKMRAVFVSHCPTFARAKEVFLAEFVGECRIVGGLSGECVADVMQSRCGQIFDARDYD